MGIVASVHFRIDEVAVRDLVVDPQIVNYLFLLGEQFAEDLRSVTPKDTGAGAASIGPHTSRARGATDVGWDKAHWYLIFPEYGTKFQPAQRFARSLLDRYRF